MAVAVERYRISQDDVAFLECYGANGHGAPSARNGSSERHYLTVDRGSGGRGHGGRGGCD